MFPLRQFIYQVFKITEMKYTGKQRFIDKAVKEKIEQTTDSALAMIYHEHRKGEDQVLYNTVFDAIANYALKIESSR